MNVTVPSSNTSHGVLKLVCAALLWVICFSLARGQQTCYWPNGTPAESPDYKEYLPCHDGNSTCCAVNEICISNGLCFGSIIEQPYRGACTNPDWTGCPNQYCNDVISDGWVNLWKCPRKGESGESNAYWWCGSLLATPCIEGQNARTMPVAGGQLLNKVTSTQTSTQTSRSTILSSTAAASSSTAGQSPSGTVQKSPSNAVTNPRNTVTFTPVGDGRKSGDSKTSVAVGAGVGIPLGMAALGFLGFLLWRARRQNKVVLTQMPPPPSSEMRMPELTGNAPPYGELVGDGGGVELVGDGGGVELGPAAPVPEMYTKPMYNHLAGP